LTPASSAKPYVFEGQHLNKLLGRVEHSSEGLSLISLQEGRAVLSSGRVGFSAQMFQFMRLRQIGLGNRLVLEFFWRQRGQENQVKTQRLTASNSDPVMLDLSVTPGWNGEIVEFGFTANGVLQQPLEIAEIRFESASFYSNLHLIWEQWWAYGDWKGTSVNFISEGRYDKSRGIAGPDIAMLPVVAVWLAVSLLLWMGLMQFGAVKARRPQWHALLAMLLIAWFVLDARWMHQIWQRNQQSTAQYDTKTQQQKWRAGKDGDWYQMATEIKQQLAADKSARILQIFKSQQPLDEYYQLRMRYHLSPHNVNPYLNTLPNAQFMHAGDYILELGEQPKLHYNPVTQTLTDKDSNVVIAAQLKYQAKLGHLYRISGE
jgi:hypothetical protein